jgi:hypothetical protein
VVWLESVEAQPANVRHDVDADQLLIALVSYWLRIGLGVSLQPAAEVRCEGALFDRDLPPVSFGYQLRQSPSGFFLRALDRSNEAPFAPCLRICAGVDSQVPRLPALANVSAVHSARPIRPMPVDEHPTVLVRVRQRFGHRGCCSLLCLLRPWACGRLLAVAALADRGESLSKASGRALAADAGVYDNIDHRRKSFLPWH